MDTVQKADDDGRYGNANTWAFTSKGHVMLEIYNNDRKSGS
jgi:hypothetical protein